MSAATYAQNTRNSSFILRRSEDTRATPCSCFATRPTSEGTRRLEGLLASSCHCCESGRIWEARWGCRRLYDVSGVALWRRLSCNFSAGRPRRISFLRVDLLKCLMYPGFRLALSLSLCQLGKTLTLTSAISYFRTECPTFGAMGPFEAGDHQVFLYQRPELGQSEWTCAQIWPVGNS